MDQTNQLPDEIWNLIILNCCENGDLQYYASRRLITKVLAVASKRFNELIQQAQLELEIPSSLADYCCQKGYASLLKYALDNGSPIEIGGNATRITSEFGHLECLKILVEHGCNIDQNTLCNTLEKAALNGHLEVVKYLVEEKNIEITILAISFAVRSGNIELFEYIRTKTKIGDYAAFGPSAVLSGLAMVKHLEQFTPLAQKNIGSAGYKGSIEVLQYFIDKGFKLDCVELCQKASAKGHLDFIKFALKHGAPVDFTVMANCAKYDDVDLIRMLHARGCSWDITVAEIAAVHGRLEVLKYLVENGCPILAPQRYSPRKYADLVTVACACRGQLSCLQYLIERGAPCPINIIHAVLNDGTEILDSHPEGQLAVVKYLHEKGYAWGVATPLTATAGAAAWGNLELLKYLHQNGCPWDATCCAKAASRGRVDCLEYALDNGCECKHRLIMYDGFASGSLVMLKFLLARGFTWPDDACDILVKKGSLSMLRYVHENGAKWTRDTISSALKTSAPSLPCIKYAIQNGCPWDPKHALETTKTRNFKSIAEWIKNTASLP